MQDRTAPQGRSRAGEQIRALGRLHLSPERGTGAYGHRVPGASDTAADLLPTTRMVGIAFPFHRRHGAPRGLPGVTGQWEEARPLGTQPHGFTTVLPTAPSSQRE